METQHDKRKKQTRQTLQPLAVSIEGASQLTSLSKSLIERLTREGRFPPPLKASDNRAIYSVEQIKNWLDSLPKSDILPVKQPQDTNP